MDEVRLLTTLDHSGARFISMAFERDTSTSANYRNLDRFAQEMGINWELYWGGRANKKAAANAFPFLDQVISFPTTLFIQGNEVTVHSGFNGPATGRRYAIETKRFQDQLNGATSLGNH
jgi:phage I-like protein